MLWRIYGHFAGTQFIQPRLATSDILPAPVKWPCCLHVAERALPAATGEPLDNTGRNYNNSHSNCDSDSNINNHNNRTEPAEPNRTV